MIQAPNLSFCPPVIQKKAYLSKVSLFAIVASLILHAGLFLWFIWSPAGQDSLRTSGRAPVTVTIIMPAGEDTIAPEKLPVETHDRNIERQPGPVTKKIVKPVIAKKSTTKTLPSVTAANHNRKIIRQPEPLESKPVQQATTEPALSAQQQRVNVVSHFPAVSIHKGEADYFDTIRAWLEKHKTYPRRARIKGMEGEVIISFTYNRDGQILSKQMLKSSGYDILDRAALSTLHAANPLPAIPDSLNKNQVTLNVPFGFNLM